MIQFTHRSAHVFKSAHHGTPVLRVASDGEASLEDSILVEKSGRSWQPMPNLSANKSHGKTKKLGLWTDKNNNNEVDKGEIETPGEQLKVRGQAFVGAELVVHESEAVLHTVHAPKSADPADIKKESKTQPWLWVTDGEGLNHESSPAFLPPGKIADTLTVMSVYGEIPDDVPPVTTDMGEAWKLIDHLREQEFRTERHWEHQGKKHVTIKEGSFTDIRLNNSKKKTKVNLTTEASAHSHETTPDGVAHAISVVASRAGKSIVR